MLKCSTVTLPKIEKQVTALQPTDKKMTKHVEREIMHQEELNWAKHNYSVRGKIIFADNFRVDFMKTFIFTLIETNSFRLFHKHIFNALRNRLSCRQIMALVKTFQQGCMIIVGISAKRIPDTAVFIPGSRRIYLTFFLHSSSYKASKLQQLNFYLNLKVFLMPMSLTLGGCSPVST